MKPESKTYRQGLKHMKREAKEKRRKRKDMLWLCRWEASETERERESFKSYFSIRGPSVRAGLSLVFRGDLMIKRKSKRQLKGKDVSFLR